MTPLTALASHRLAAVALLAAALVAPASAAQNCRSPAGADSATLAAPERCPAPKAKKAEPAKKPEKQDGFWTGVRIGGSVSTTTTFQGR